MRQRIENIGEGIVAINDAYNANPVSMRAALETLASLSGRQFAVLGDMLELGEDEQAFHSEILNYGLQLQIETFVWLDPCFNLSWVHSRIAIGLQRLKRLLIF